MENMTVSLSAHAPIAYLFLGTENLWPIPQLFSVKIFQKIGKPALK